jgi:maltodextrin utilization protein YvdJ
MKQSEKNFSGKINYPWYDSEGLCIFLIVFMSLVFLFGISGIVTALKTDYYDLVIKIPAALSIMSFYIVFSVSIRLYKRRKINKSLGFLDFYRK